LEDGSIPKRNENTGAQSKLYTNVHVSIVHYSQRVGIAHYLSNNEWKNVACPYNGILLSNKNECHTYSQDGITFKIYENK
jgi:hypothetical protein